MDSNEDYHRSPSPGSKHDKEKVVIEVNNGVKKRVSIPPHCLLLHLIPSTTMMLSASLI